MRCVNCGKTIPDNSSYCIYCHAPTEISGDINVNIDILEDDELLSEFAKKEQQRIHQVEIKEAEGSPKKKKTLIISMVGFICSLLFVVILGANYLNSYTYIIRNANKAYNNGDYESAYKLYERALDKNPESVDALVGAGEAAAYTGKYEKSESYLTKALDIDKENSKAYSSLLDLYSTNDDQDKISEAIKYAQTEEMKETFNEVAIESPEFSIEGGDYEEDLSISLSSKSNLQIYYTLNGKDPTAGEGILYMDDIVLTEGTTIVKAACFKKGTFGPVCEQIYNVKYSTPGLPTISPMNGTFTEETKVTIRSEVPGAKIYYTWDGTTPTARSEKYQGPIVIPAGNNVLSVVVINSNGKSSEVLCCSYTYTPSEEIENPEGEVVDGENPGEVSGEVVGAPTGDSGSSVTPAAPVSPDNSSDSSEEFVPELEYIFDRFSN